MENDFNKIINEFRKKLENMQIKLNIYCERHNVLFGPNPECLDDDGKFTRLNCIECQKKNPPEEIIDDLIKREIEEYFKQ